MSHLFIGVLQLHSPIIKDEFPLLRLPALYGSRDTIKPERPKWTKFQRGFKIFSDRAVAGIVAAPV
jgi:hypothetical protein